jgi:hypothetical protein
MIIGASEGHGFRYEIVDHEAGYLVHMRDLDSGAVQEADAKVFRTAAVAFAYAELSAAFDRYASARMAGEAPEHHIVELEAMQATLEDLSRRLGDEGMTAHMLVSWEAAAEAAQRRRLH